MEILPGRYRLRVAVLAVAVLVSLARWAAADAALDDYNLAVQLYKQSRWSLAAESFRKFLKDHPEHERTPFARLYLGLTLVNQADYKSAREVLRSFARDYPQNQNVAQARYRVGECSYLLNDLPAAKADLQTYLKDHPDDTLAERAWPYLGDVLLRLNEPEAAATAFSQAVSKFPKGPLVDDAQFGWAKALEAQKQFPEAQAKYQQLADGDGPRAAEALFQVGNRYFDAGQFAEAAKIYRQLPQRFPQHALVSDAHLNAGFAMYRAGNAIGAVVEFEEAAKDPARAVTAGYWQGLCLKSQEKFLEAIDVFNRVAESAKNQPQLEPILFQRGLCERAAGRTADAQQTLLSVVTRFGKGDYADDALHFAAEMAIDAGDLTAAQERLDRFAQAYSRSGLRMYHELLAGRLELARAAADVAKGVDPKPIEKRYQTAAARFDLVLNDSTLERTRWQARYYSALTRQLMGRHAEALELIQPLTEAVRTKPDAAEFADAFVLEADSLLQTDQSAATAKAVDEYLAKSPSGRQSARALSLLALATATQGDASASAKALDRLQQEFPNHPQILTTLLRLQEQAERRSDWPSAAAIAQRLMEAAKGTDQEPYARRGLAWAQFQQRQFTEAAETFGQLATDFPQHRLTAEAAYYHAEAIREAGSATAAAKAFSTAFQRGKPKAPAEPGVEREPPLLFVYRAGLQVARTLRQEKQIEAADQAYAALLTSFPKAEGLDKLLDEWALLNYDAERFAEADRIFQRLVQETPDSDLADNARLSLAESALVAGNLTAARKAFEDLRASPKSDAQVRERASFQLLVLTLEERRWAEIPPLASEFLKSFPESASRPYVEYGVVEAVLAAADVKPDVVEAQLEALDQLLRDPPSSAGWTPRLWVLKAEALFRLKRYDDIAATVADFRQRLPQSPLAYQIDEVYGRALKQQAKFAEARDVFQNVIADKNAYRTETAAKCQFLIAETYFLQEKWQDAFLAYQKVYASYAFPEWQAAALMQSGKCDEQLGHWKEAAATYAQLQNEFPKSSLLDEARKRQQVARQRAGQS
jgi:TolA-binding protein